MSKYKYLLFDADNTLFDFDKSEKEAFKTALGLFNIEYTDEIYGIYHVINDKLWKMLEKGETTRDELKFERFRQFASAVGCSADYRDIARKYEKSLGMQVFEIEGNFEVLKTFSEKYKMYVITNGITEVQESRFSRSRFTELFESVYISEKLGVSKPSKLFFDYVFEDIGDFDLSRYLVIGDSLTSDIDGALNSGVDSCWYNRYGLSCEGRKITYEIRHMKELADILN